jgi:hypothetical protein
MHDRIQRIGGSKPQPKPIIPFVQVGNKIQFAQFSTFGMTSEVFSIKNLAFRSDIGGIQLVHLEFHFSEMQSLEEFTQDIEDNKMIFNLGWTDQIRSPRITSPIMIANGREYTLEAFWDVDDLGERVDINVYIFSEPAPQIDKKLS